MNLSYNLNGPEQPSLSIAVPRRKTDGAEETPSKALLPDTGYRWCFCLSVAPWRCDMSKSKTKAEKLHLSRVAALGCVVCRNLNYGESPAEIHHCSSGTGLSVRADNFHVIPLCHAHHRTGGYGVAIHAGRKSWEEKFGTEAELLSQVLQELGETVND